MNFFKKDAAFLASFLLIVIHLLLVLHGILWVLIWSTSSVITR